MTQLDELLREHRQRVATDDDVERHALDHARYTLRAAVVSESAPRPRRASRPGVRRFAVVAGLAAAIASVVALLPGTTGNDTSQLGPATASAQILLRQASRAISHQPWQPLRPGQYFYYREIGSDTDGRGPAPARPTFIQDTWVGADGFGRLVQTGPDTVIAGGDVLIFHATPQQLNAERQTQSHGAHLRILSYGQPYRWADLDYRQLISLPTDPSKLERFIEQHASGGGPRFSDIFSIMQNYLDGAPLPPKVSAAMYRVIARLPGMRLIGPTRDPLGRPGVAVGLFFKGQPGRIELIFDPRTGVLLGERAISLNAKEEHAPVGSVTNWSVIERQGTVRSATTPVTGNTP